MSKIGHVLLFSALLLSTSYLLQTSLTGSSNDLGYLGFASYITSQTELEKTIALMELNGLDVYRVSFKPNWEVPDGEVRGYNTAYIDYLLANTNFTIVVDGNHLYPAKEDSDYAALHWTEVTDRVFQVLENYPNNSRVAVELINEYTHSDYNTKMQLLINDTRNAGYTNPIVTNKLTTAWLKFQDPLNNTYQGMHFYFNSWEVNETIQQLNIAYSRGITKILNTEVGASADEYKKYNQSNVDALESYLNQTQTMGVKNCVWMNNDTLNLQGYTQYGLFNDNLPIKQTPPPTVEPEYKSESKSTGTKSTTTPSAKPTQTPTLPSPIISPTPQPSEIEAHDRPIMVWKLPISGSAMLLL